MLHWFTEDAIFPVITGSILAMIFLGFAISSREKIMLYIALAIGAVAAMIGICEALIVTDRESVTEEVYLLASHVQNNDLDRVVSFVDPREADTVARVKQEMPGYDFDTCQMTGISDFEVVGANPKVVAITFNVAVRVRLGRNPETLYGQRRVKLFFQKSADGKWKIIDYQHWDPRKGLSV